MAKVKLAKIQVVGRADHYEILTAHLQQTGNVHVSPCELPAGDRPHERETFEARYDLSRIEGALSALAPYQSPKSKLDSLLSGGKIILKEKELHDRLKAFEQKAEQVLDEVFEAEEGLIREQNQIKKTPVIRSLARQLESFSAELGADFDTDMTRTFIGSVKKGVDKELMRLLASETNLVDTEILSQDKKEVFVRITVLEKYEPWLKGILESVRFKAFDFATLEPHYGKTVEDLLAWCDREESRIQSEIKKHTEKLKKLAAHTDDLRIYYDYQLWHKHKADLEDRVYISDMIFAFEGWMPEAEFGSLKNWIQKAFAGEVGITKAQITKEDQPPVLMKNKTGIRSFEPIVGMFGLPGKEDFDPTAAVAPFFFTFFGLCLSDVGYGLILTVVSLFFLLFGRFSRGAKHSLALLLLCGIGATIGGVILGGYFGLEPDQAPGFLVDPETGTFRGQLFVPLEGAGPMTFLSLALGLGAIHLLVGVFLEGIKKWMNGDILGAFLDSWAWFFFLLSLALFGVSGKVEALDGSLWANLSLVGAGILVLTQGRSQKNWLMKPIVGILALYGSTSYLSDLLSYARIMALGLATGVVGFAMNLTAGVIYDLMPFPWLGLIAAAIVAVCGHGLNFALSTLGAFIHSGRLQFIEFFGKFYEAGGKPFSPFGKAFKYCFVKER